MGFALFLAKKQGLQAKVNSYNARLMELSNREEQLANMRANSQQQVNDKNNQGKTLSNIDIFGTIGADIARRNSNKTSENSSVFETGLRTPSADNSKYISTGVGNVRNVNNNESSINPGILGTGGLAFHNNENIDEVLKNQHDKLFGNSEIKNPLGTMEFLMPNKNNEESSINPGMLGTGGLASQNGNIDDVMKNMHDRLFGNSEIKNPLGTMEFLMPNKEENSSLDEVSDNNDAGQNDIAEEQKMLDMEKQRLTSLLQQAKAELQQVEKAEQDAIKNGSSKFSV